MRRLFPSLLVCLLAGMCVWSSRAQTPAPPTAAADGQPPSQLTQRIEALSAAIAAAQQRLEDSQREMQQLQQELQALREQIPAATVSSAPVTAADPAPAPIEERIQVLEAAVKLHDQTKVESASKYPVRLTGLVLFNGFLNRGLPDNNDLPAIAQRQTATSGSGSLGAGLRQTILGIEGNGPVLHGAHTSANINFDFFSGVSYTNYGTSAGTVRMRTASIDFHWTNDSLEVGMVEPLISPLSPSSFATVAEPALAGAGNLWTWAPQLRYMHQFPLRNASHLQFEFGLWDSASAGYNPNQFFRTASPGELSNQPAYETRISYAGKAEHGLQLGVGSYYSRQSYPGYAGTQTTENLDSWAATIDWRVPFARRFELSGEGYRGRSLGGLGGGLYKDAVTGTSPATGQSVLRRLNAIGGWTQFKTRFSDSTESNVSIGLDDAFARDFHAVALSPTASATLLRARNRMAMANLIYRPRTYLILSPEYRRIWTWPINSQANTLNVFTLSVGYQF